MPLKRYEVKLDIFEGPMDLLIHLIRKNEVDIYDIPIALITDQFLEYLEWLQTLDINVTGDFLLMSATLAKIKSSMLLPSVSDEDEEDPRLEITRPLIEYLQLKSAAEKLMERQLLGEDTFTRTIADDELPSLEQGQIVRVGLFELIDAFKKILDNVPAEHKIDLYTDRISIKDRIDEIIERIENEGSIVFDDLFQPPILKSDIVVTFLAILEMVKLNIISIVQHVQSGIIRLFYV